MIAAHPVRADERRAGQGPSAIEFGETIGGTCSHIFRLFDNERMCARKRIAAHSGHLPRHLDAGCTAGDRELVAGDLARDIEPR